MNRSAIIDSLRAIAVLSVIFYHYGMFRYGLYGVSLFFIISGYCILISAESSVGAWNFYAKRLSRLAPALLFCAGLTVFIKQTTPLIPDRMANWNDYFLTLISLPTLNVFSFDFSWPDGAYWSLAIEFRFYALVSLILIFGGRRYIPCGIAAISILLTVLAIKKPDFSSIVTPYLPYFLAGIAIKIIYRDGKKQLGFILLGLSFCISILHYIYKISDPSIPTSAESLVAFALCIALFFIALSFIGSNKKPDQKKNITLKSLSFVGLVSYPLYLLHQDIGYWVLAFLNREFNLTDHMEIDLVFRLMIIPGCVLILAVAVYLFIEKPTIQKTTILLSMLPTVTVNTAFSFLDKAKIKPSIFLAKAVLVCLAGVALTLMVFVMRLNQHSDAAITIGIIQNALKGDSPVNFESAWGVIKIVDTHEERIIDIENVPFSSCPRILVESSKNVRVKRVSASSRSADEMSTPVSQFRAELACAGLKNKTIRVIARISL